MPILRLTSLCTALAALACSATSGPHEADPIEQLESPLTDAHYVDARDYFTSPEAIDGWYALTRSLKSDFDAICGDTFCEGDYGNYESLGFRCSVERRSGVVGRCVWILAASQDEIDPATGKVTVHGKVWRCAMPIAKNTAAAALLGELSHPGQEPLHARLPGSERSLYDGLVDCL
jgi:hypothetical protein